jgi:hypothetical protein
MHLVGCIIRIYHDARSSERQILTHKQIYNVVNSIVLIGFMI